VFKEYSLRGLKESSKEKSNNALTLAIKKFKEEGLINERKIGRSSLYCLNLENDLVWDYVSLANHSKLPDLVKKTLRILKEELERYTPFYSIAIFGSYAVNEQKKGSDLDIAVFIEKEKDRKIVQMALNMAGVKSLLNLHGYLITKGEFHEMLTNDEANLGKEIALKHLALNNAQIFYSLIQKGMKGGFNLQELYQEGAKRT